MGEQSADVVEVSFRLRELEVPSIPVNFLIPIEGNPVQSDGSLTPERCLRALCLMRLVNPRAEIRAAGGREGHLRGHGGARALARELALRRGLPHDARRRARRHLPDDPRGRLRGGRQPAPARRDGGRAEVSRSEPKASEDHRAGFRLRGEAPAAAARSRARRRMACDLAEIAAETLAEIRARGTHRRMRVLDGAQAPRMRVDGRDVLLFAGSNYLDLARHPEVVEASARAAREIGCAAGGSRLISGNLALHEALEQELAKFFEAEAALAFNSGYAANLGVIPALVGKGDAVVSDALSHASIIDGCRLSRADVLVFPHGDLAALEPRSPTPRARTAACCSRSTASTAWTATSRPWPRWSRSRSATARSCCSTTRTAPARSARAGAAARSSAASREASTCCSARSARALGSYGAFVVGTRALRELLVNVARSFIFSCALAPPQVAAAHAALELVRREPWRRERLQANAARLRARLAARGVDTRPSTTHIVPVVIGENDAAMAACERLLERGFYAQGIRHPSVPEGTARLRLTPMATHREDEIDALADAVADEVQRDRSERWHRGVFVTGTDTGVGKTVVACALAARAARARDRRGRDEADRDGRRPGRARRRDRVARRRGRTRSARRRLPAARSRCRRRRAVAAAPRAAASISPRSTPPTRACARAARSSWWRARAACSCRSTRSSRWPTSRSASALPLLVVARAALGTINHTRLTLEAARARGLRVAGVVISHAGGAALRRGRGEPRALRERARRALVGEIPPLAAGELPAPTRSISTR